MKSTNKIKRWLIGIIAIRVLMLESFVVEAQPRYESSISYVGSSTIGYFIVDAQQEFTNAEFLINTRPESYGGQQAILAGEADLAGVAGIPAPELRDKGISSTLIGKDAIAVIVNQSNPIKNLSSEQLKGIFTGKINSWKELGGYDLPIRPLIVSPKSATREVFKEKILGDDNYQGCEVIEPDRRIVEEVAQTPEAIGQISFSFLMGEKNVKALYIEGQEPSVTNFDYPIFRPLYLLTRGQPEARVKEFVDWALGVKGQRIVMHRFIGVNVLASVKPKTLPPKPKAGFLKVYTERFEFRDSDIYYYPHHPYEVFNLYGEKIKYVQNHFNNYDEDPTLVELPPGKYLVVPESRKKRQEILILVEEGKTTEVDVEKLLTNLR